MVVLEHGDELETFRFAGRVDRNLGLPDVFAHGRDVADRREAGGRLGRHGAKHGDRERGQCDREEAGGQVSPADQGARKGLVVKKHC